MKKNFTSLLILLVAIVSNAQINTSTTQIKIKGFYHSNEKAMNDTLFYMPLIDVFINPTDSALFYLEWNDNFTGGTPASGMTGFNAFYSVDSTNSFGDPAQNNMYQSWENPLVDSAFFWGATSDFIAPGGAADDWLEFGPITIPPSGATIKWQDRTWNNRDGYDLLFSTSGMANYVDFTNPPVFSKTDSPSPSITYATDTAWQERIVPVSNAFSGMQLYFAYHHTATNMSWLMLDNILIVEGLPSCDANFSVVQDSSDLFNYYVYNSSSSGSTYSYLWDFGDSTTSNLQYPTHVYTWAGPFQLCLTVSDSSGCSDMHCDSIHPGIPRSTGTTVTVLPPTVAGISSIEKNSSFKIYPNPLNSNATINYSVNQEGLVELCVFDLLGNKISTLETGSKQAGSYSYKWNAENISKGMYLMQLKIGNTISSKKIIIAK